MSNKSLSDHLNGFIKAKKDADATKLTSQPYRDFYNCRFIGLKKLSKKYVDDNIYSTTAGSAPENATKNRYKDILPFDYTRVELEKIKGQPHSDYINANFIKDIYEKKHYIASQGPMPTTLVDFWRMTWQYKIKLVIMACNEYEGIPPKCSMQEAERLFLDETTPIMFKPKLRCKRYWPVEESPLVIEELNLTLTFICEHTNETGEYLVREMKASRNGEERTVIQLHYVSWPDHGVPPTPFPLLDMIAEAREYQKLSREGPPLLIHCSAGCGRTGTIIVIDYCWSLIKTGFSTCTKFDLHEILSEMRKQRPSMVQSVEQYEFVFNVVAELFQRQLECMDDNIYVNLSDEENDTVEKDDDIYENIATKAGESDYDVPSSKPSLATAATKPGRHTLNALRNQTPTDDKNSGLSGTGQPNASAARRPPISNKPRLPSTGTASESTKPETKPLHRTPSDKNERSENGLAQPTVPAPGGYKTRIIIQNEGEKISTQTGQKTMITVGKEADRVSFRPVEMRGEYSEPYQHIPRTEDTYSLPINMNSSNHTRKDPVRKVSAGSLPKSPSLPSNAACAEYAYADPNNTEKWSMQKRALAGKQQTEPLYATAYEDFEVVPEKKSLRKKGSWKNRGHVQKSRSEGSEPTAPTIPHRPPNIFPPQRKTTDEDSTSNKSADSVTSLNDPKGSVSKKTGIINKVHGIMGLPRTADPTITSAGKPEEFISKGEDISFPQRTKKPTGPRNPSNFHLPEEYTHL